jgi:hypothetical protein
MAAPAKDPTEAWSLFNERFYCRIKRWIFPETFQISACL